MSVLQGFAMLNNAIRNIRLDNQQHMERMEQLDQQKAQVEYQMNDPQRLLQRQKAAAELKPTQFTIPNIGRFNNIKDKEHYEMFTKPAVESVLGDEGISLNKDGVPVWKETNQPVEMPAWKARTLSNKVSMATIASRFGNSDLDMKIDKLSTSLDKKRKEFSKSGGAKSKLEGMYLATKQSELDELIKQRSDPNEQVKRLMDTNAGLSKMYKAALSDPNMDPSFFERLNAFHKINNDELELLLKQMGDKSKDFVGVNYHWRDSKTGETITRTTYMPKSLAGMAPNTWNMGDHIFTRGDAKKVGGETGGGGSDKGHWTSMTSAQQDSVNEKYTNAKILASAAEIDVSQEEMIKNRLKAGGKSQEEADMLYEQIRTNAGDVFKEEKDLVRTYELKYKNAPWFKPNILGKDTETQAPSWDKKSFAERLAANRKKKQ